MSSEWAVDNVKTLATVQITTQSTISNVFKNDLSTDICFSRLHLWENNKEFHSTDNLTPQNMKSKAISKSWLAFVIQFKHWNFIIKPGKIINICS